MVTLASNAWTISETLRLSDLVIGGVLIPGASAPKLVRREMIARMKRGSVVVDVAIDQGGCFETSHATTHSDPVYIVDNVLHYCVSNMPAAVPHTSTFALTNATFPYLLGSANKGLARAANEDPGLLRGSQHLTAARVTHHGVAESQGRLALHVQMADNIRRIACAVLDLLLHLWFRRGCGDCSRSASRVKSFKSSRPKKPSSAKRGRTTPTASP